MFTIVKHSFLDVDLGEEQIEFRRHRGSDLEASLEMSQGVKAGLWGQLASAYASKNRWYKQE